MIETSPKTIDRRAQLLKAAREVLADKGLDGARVSEIVKRAGVSQGTFYLYFSSKVSVVAEFDREMQEAIQKVVLEAIAEAPDVSEAIEESVKAALAELGRYQDILGVVLSRLGYHEGASQREEFERPYHEMVTRLLQNGQTSGEVDPTLDPTLTARLIVGLIERAGADCYVYHPELPNDRFAAETAYFIRRALIVR